MSGIFTPISTRMRGTIYKFHMYASFMYKRSRISPSTILRMEKNSQIIFGKGSRVVELGKIILKQGAILTIGNNTSIDRICEIIVEENSNLTIGDNVFIGSHSNIRVTGEMVIGNDCRIAQFVSIINGSYGFEQKDILISEQSYKNGFVVVGNDVWLGLSAIILPNTTIG